MDTSRTKSDCKIPLSGVIDTFLLGDATPDFTSFCRHNSYGSHKIVYTYFSGNY